MRYYRNHGRPLAAVYVVLQNYLDFGYAVNVLKMKFSGNISENTHETTFFGQCQIGFIGQN